MLEDQIRIVRDKHRIASRDVIERLFTHFIEFHGDQLIGDDQSLTAGVGLLDQNPVTVLAVNRGRTIQERQRFNGGLVGVSGYRKALRMIRAAEKFDRPVVSFIDMPGADASVTSENLGQSKAIADMITQMGLLTVPNVAVFLGEGHSGGALAFANANQILMLENALFSVASPEAVAAIVSTKQDVSEYLPMTAQQLLDLGLIDRIIPENTNLLENIHQGIVQQLEPLQRLNGEMLVQQRTQKFNQFLEGWK